MKFCISCGHKLKDDQTVCPSCGENRSMRNAESQNKHAAENESKQTSSRLQNKKKVFTFVGGIVAALIFLSVLAGLYISEKKKSDPLNIVTEFERAVKDSDANEIIAIIEQGDSELKSDEKIVKEYLNYLNANPELLESNFAVLEKKADALANNTSAKLETELVNEWFDISKSGKKWGFIDQYYVEVKPFYVEVNSNLSDTVILLDGEEKGKVKDDGPVKIGPILPGAYEVEAKYKGKYSTLEEAKKLDFSNAEDNLLKVGIQLKGSFITLVTDPEAEIYINGKQSSINPKSAVDIGPIATDGSVKVYAELKTEDETLKSEIVTILNDNDVYLDFDYTAASLVKKVEQEETTVEGSDDYTDETTTVESDYSDSVDDSYGQTELQSYMTNFITYSVAALNYGDFSYVSPYLDPNGPGYEETRKYIDYAYNKGISEELQYTNLDRYEIINDRFIEVWTTEKYLIRYSDGSEEYKTFESHYRINTSSGELLVNELISTNEI
jgi:membrane-associated protein TcaA